MKYTIKESLKILGATKKKITNNIYLIRFDDRVNMCKVVLRFAEHYESPKFRNKIFTLKEFKKWYATTIESKRFTYYYDWAGFNIPSYSFAAFKEKKFNPLSYKEKLFLNIIKNLKEPYYIIVASGKGKCSSTQHELAHGLFYMSEKYKKEVLKVLSKTNIKKFKKELLDHGYCKEVILDEINAYAIDGSAEIDKRVCKKLKILFEKYLKIATKDKR